jgi:glycosyltransferase involved in cell wall biosynthesis
VAAVTTRTTSGAVGAGSGAGPDAVRAAAAARIPRTGLRSGLRVDMVVPSLPAAGMEVMVAALARALHARGHAVAVTCLRERGQLADGLEQDGIPVRVVPAPGVLSNLRAPALAAHFAATRPDVVHAHSGVWGPAARAARHAGTRRVIHTVHGLLDREPWFGPALKRWAGWHTDVVAAVSAPLRDYLVERARVPARKVVTLPNGIDTTQFTPDGPRGALRTRLGVAPERRLVGIVARFAPVKNHALLIDAFARVAERDPSVDLVLIGDGELREAITAQVHARGLVARVHFAGLSADTAAWYRDLTVFSLTSVAEGTSISVLEAMATGLPIVATAVGGTPALLADGAAGVLVPSNDPLALADALTAVLGDPARRQQLGEAARARACAVYSAEQMVRAYEHLYDGT